MHWMNGYGGWFMGGMWLFWILLLLVLAVVVRWVIVGFRQEGRTGITGGDGIRTPDAADDILKRRYARGEISREEFESRLHAVHG